MRHRKAGRKLGRDWQERKALFRQQAISLILNERITTTEAKAKSLRPVVEKLITTAREDTPYNRKLVLDRLAHKPARDKLFDIVGPRYEGQNGGYTRIFKLGTRKGDGAEMALIELI
ncbi:MAG: 50S ribosomal protein L17 [Thermomicrobiales bacterium]|jgi:large subunit ribosomal protein L17|nr:50S ribosomal protein L17 [Thermomicrobiales bacterium]